MPQTAISEDTQTTAQAFDSPTDEIASLLLGDEEADTSGELDDEETLSDDSTDEEEVDDSEAETDDDTETVSEDESEEATWGGALGVPEETIAFNEEGDIVGVNVKVDGKTSTVSMGDLIKDYQGNKSVTEKSQSLATERKAFDEAKEVVQKDYSSKLENVELITNYLSNKLVSEFEGINWDQLRVENPAEYAAARQDYASRANELKQAQDAVAQEKEQSSKEQTAKFEERHNKYMLEQFDILIQNNPLWADEETRSTGMTELQTFTTNQYGYTEQDFKSVSDARLIEMAKDAMAYRKGVKMATTKRKKKVPKFQKSAGKGVRKVSKLDKLTKAAKSATGANKRQAQTDAVAELLIGG